MAVVKFSRQREAIRNNLAHRYDHPTADMVYQDIRREFPHISLGTVYRNLSLLAENGEIQKIFTIIFFAEYAAASLIFPRRIRKSC